MNLEQVQSMKSWVRLSPGAFLACGSIVDPGKSYHLEFVVPDQQLCDGLVQVLSSVHIFPKEFLRGRGSFVAYLKDSGEIEDLLGLMGAGNLGLEIMNVKIYKSIRNQVNRAQNCEFANLEKTINASAVQVKEINTSSVTRGCPFCLRICGRRKAAGGKSGDVFAGIGEALSVP